MAGQDSSSSPAVSFTEAISRYVEEVREAVIPKRDRLEYGGSSLDNRLASADFRKSHPDAVRAIDSLSRTHTAVWRLPNHTFNFDEGDVMTDPQVWRYPECLPWADLYWRCRDSKWTIFSPDACFDAKKDFHACGFFSMALRGKAREEINLRNHAYQLRQPPMQPGDLSRDLPYRFDPKIVGPSLSRDDTAPPADFYPKPRFTASKANLKYYDHYTPMDGTFAYSGERTRVPVLVTLHDGADVDITSLSLVQLQEMCLHEKKYHLTMERLEQLSDDSLFRDPSTLADTVTAYLRVLSGAASRRVAGAHLSDRGRYPPITAGALNTIAKISMLFASIDDSVEAAASSLLKLPSRPPFNKAPSAGNKFRGAFQDTYWIRTIAWERHWQDSWLIRRFLGSVLPRTEPSAAVPAPLNAPISAPHPPQ